MKVKLSPNHHSQWSRQRVRPSAFSLLFSVCMVFIFLSACSSPASPSSSSAESQQPNPGAAAANAEMAEQQVLKYVTLNMPRSLDPTNVDAQRITSDGIAEPLVMLNDDATLRPLLAKSWTSIEPALWEVELQPHVKFWSGAVMDASAVKAALERHQKLNKRASSQLGGVAFIVKDATHLQIRTPKPDPAFMFKLTGFAIHNAAEAERLGDAFNKQADLTGFMKPTEFIPGELLIAEANAQYWGDKPKLARVEARLGSDGQARLLAMKSGDTDADMNVEVEQRISYEKNKRFNVLYPPGSTRNLWLNIKKVAAFQDPKVRLALSLALDRKELIEGVSRGFAEPVTGHFPKGLPYSLHQGPESDRAKAAKLLDEAGWKPGTDGIRTKDGQKLSFKLLTYSFFQPTAIALQSQYKAVGVHIDISPVETTASNQLMLDGNFEMATYCSCGSVTGDLGGQLKSYYYTGLVSNYGGYSNSEVDTLIDQLSAEFEPARQYELAHQIQQIVLDETAIIYMYNSASWGSAYNSKVKGVDNNLRTKIVPGMYIGK